MVPWQVATFLGFSEQRACAVHRHNVRQLKRKQRRRRLVKRARGWFAAGAFGFAAIGTLVSCAALERKIFKRSCDVRSRLRSDCAVAEHINTG